MNDPPYRGVRGCGPVTIAPDDHKETLGSPPDRYLGGTDLSLARHPLDPACDEMTISVAPERCYSRDLSDRTRDAGGGRDRYGSLCPGAGGPPARLGEPRVPTDNRPCDTERSPSAGVLPPARRHTGTNLQP
ncbi:MAG: hypothetical protein ABEH58_06355 [Haloplanus sp.]